MLVSSPTPPFPPDALAILFDRPNFRAFQKPGSLSHYWAPLISACSGARRNELFFLAPGDIRSMHGVWSMHCKATVKNGRQSAPARHIPIHPLLQRLGFLAFVEQRRRTHPNERLFSEYKAIQENAGMLFSRTFVQWIKSTVALLPEEQQRFFADDLHFPSLRALFTVEAQRSGMSPAILRVIQGMGGGEGHAPVESAAWYAQAAAEMARIDIASCFPPLCPYEELMA